METKTKINIQRIENEWAKGLTKTEVANWIEAMLEIGRFEPTGYWDWQVLVHCPFNRPLANVKEDTQ